MKLKLILSPEFLRAVKKLYKKYKHISKDLKILENELLKNPKAGIELGNNCFKLRLPNSSIPTGKSGGFRVVYYYWVRNSKIYLLYIYSKTELEDVNDKKLVEILKKNGLK